MDKKEEKPSDVPTQPAAQQPGQDVAPPPTADKRAEEKPASAPAEAPTDVSAEQPIQERPAPPKPKQPGSHVGLAIVATIIIVLGLAALATFAFLQSK